MIGWLRWWMWDYHPAYRLLRQAEGRGDEMAAARARRAMRRARYRRPDRRSPAATPHSLAKGGAVAVVQPVRARPGDR